MNDTNHKFIADKLHNFYLFCCEISAGQECPVGVSNIAKLEPLKQAKPAEFMEFIGRYVIPYKDNLPVFMRKFAEEKGWDYSKIPPAQVEKMQRYLGMFCEVMMQQ